MLVRVSQRVVVVGLHEDVVTWKYIYLTEKDYNDFTCIGVLMQLLDGVLLHMTSPFIT